MPHPDHGDLPAISAELLASLLRSGDAEAAEAFVLGLIDDGVPRIDIISRLLGPALARIGQQWQEGTITIGVEHHATFIVETLLQTTLSEVPAAAAGHRVWLTGVEGEWHTMPSRLVAGVWNCLGWNVVALTPSLPAEELRLMADWDPTRIAGVSCSLVSNLVPAWQAISVLRESGFRVIVGGRAFDAVPELGQILGADAHRQDPVEASDVLSQWIDAALLGPRPPVREQAWHRIEDVWLRLPRLVEEAVIVARELAEVTLTDKVIRQDLTLIARTSCAAAIAGKPVLLAQHMSWLRHLLETSGIDPATGEALLWSLERVLPAGEGVREVLAVV
jgi:methanogenic corrinoid protein MtbC1